jgi:hypothetical protein
MFTQLSVDQSTGSKDQWCIKWNRAYLTVNGKYDDCEWCEDVVTAYFKILSQNSTEKSKYASVKAAGKESGRHAIPWTC